MLQIRNTVFTPEARSRDIAGGAENQLKTGTTTVGIVAKDCIVLAADRRATAGHLIADKNTEKVKPVTKHIGITTAGSVSDIQLLYKYLSVELKVKHIRAGREATVKEAANLLGTWVYHMIRSQGTVAHFIVGGYDDKPQLFDVYPDGSIMDQTEFVASGSGSVFALGVLESAYKKNLPQEEAVSLIVKSVNAALARDSASGNGIDVYVIDKNGARKVFAKGVLSTVAE
jgi:proteasome beta subunit